MTESRSVLVVEDETAIREGLCDILEFHGHPPHGVETGEEGLRAALEGDYALVLLDVMLPGMNGFQVCRRLRGERPQLGILMLTAKGSEDDILEGFRCGADDYVTKPFSVAQLTARIDALLRRSAGPQATPQAPFDFGPWSIEPAERVATRHDERIELTARETAILGLLHLEHGRIVSRRRMLTEVWELQPEADVQTRTVDMHIAKLRKKLGGDHTIIETVRGEGYRYNG